MKHVTSQSILEAVSLSILILIGLGLRWSAAAKIGPSVFIDDDSYWHYALQLQVLKYGHLLNPNPYSWAPVGHPVNFAPLYEYVVPWVYLFLRHLGITTSLLSVAYYSNIPATILDIVVLYFLIKELYGWIPGLIAASLLATFDPAVFLSSIGQNREAYATIWLCLLGVWLFILC